jgi:hypothetical protein
LTPGIVTVLDIREATAEDDHPRPPGEINMMDIIIGFLVDGDDMGIAGVKGLDMGSTRFAVHDFSS